MSTFRRVHGMTLANNSWVENFHFERLSTDPAVLEAGRVWYNTAQKRYKISLRDSENNLVIRNFVDNKDLQDYFQGLDWRQEVRTVLSESFGSNASVIISGESGINGSVQIVAVNPGEEGNNITVELADPGLENQLPSVSVTDNTITFTQGTTSSVAASYVFDSAAENSDITITASNSGVNGNNLIISFVNSDAGESSVTMDGNEVIVTLEGSTLKPATYVYDNTNVFADIKFSAVTPGTAGNSLTITISDQADNSAYSSSVSGDDITINIPTTENVAAEVTSTGIGTNDSFTITSIISGELGNDWSLGIYGDTANQTLDVGVNLGSRLIYIMPETDGSYNPTSTVLEVYNALMALSDFTDNFTMAYTGDGSGAVHVAAGNGNYDYLSFTGGQNRFPTANELITAINNDSTVNTIITAEQELENWVDITDTIKTVGDFRTGSIDGNGNIAPAVSASYSNNPTIKIADLSLDNFLFHAHATKLRLTFTDLDGWDSSPMPGSVTYYNCFGIDNTGQGASITYDVANDQLMVDVSTHQDGSYEFDDFVLVLDELRPIEKIEFLSTYDEGTGKIDTTVTSDSFSGGAEAEIFSTANEIVDLINNDVTVSNYIHATAEGYIPASTNTLMGSEWWDHGASSYNTTTEVYTVPGGVDPFLSLDRSQAVNDPTILQECTRVRFNYTGVIRLVSYMNNNGDPMILGGDLTSYTSGEWIELDRATWPSREIYFIRIEFEVDGVGGTVSDLEFEMPSSGADGIVDTFTATNLQGGQDATSTTTAAIFRSTILATPSASALIDVNLLGTGAGIPQSGTYNLSGASEIDKVPSVIDGISMEVDDRFLIRSASNKANNGIYSVLTTPPPVNEQTFEIGTGVSKVSYTPVGANTPTVNHIDSGTPGASFSISVAGDVININLARDNGTPQTASYSFYTTGSEEVVTFSAVSMGNTYNRLEIHTGTFSDNTANNANVRYEIDGDNILFFPATDASTDAITTFQEMADAIVGSPIEGILTATIPAALQNLAIDEMAYFYFSDDAPSKIITTAWSLVQAVNSDPIASTLVVASETLGAAENFQDVTTDVLPALAPETWQEGTWDGTKYVSTNQYIQFNGEKAIDIFQPSKIRFTFDGITNMGVSLYNLYSSHTWNDTWSVATSGVTYDLTPYPDADTLPNNAYIENFEFWDDDYGSSEWNLTKIEVLITSGTAAVGSVNVAPQNYLGIERASDADSNDEVNQGIYCFVMEGTKYKGAGFVLTTRDPITLGTSELDFSQFASKSEVEAGLGLSKDGNELSVKLDGSTLQVTENGLSVVSSVTELLELADTPSVYGNPGQVLGVNPSGNSLTWVDAGTDPSTQVEIDATQAAAGLNADGTYITPSQTIISTSTTLAEADAQLATAVETLVNSLNAKTYTFTSTNPALTHVITHNLDNENLEITVWVYNTISSKYEIDTVGVEQTDTNTITINLTDSSNIKAIIKSASALVIS